MVQLVAKVMAVMDLLVTLDSLLRFRDGMPFCCFWLAFVDGGFESDSIIFY
jgi:hypothetical protein